jgi:hypothetical protein
VYVDDGRVVREDKERPDADYKLTFETFDKAGFTMAVEKLDVFGASSHRKEYLRFLIDTATMTVKVKEVASMLGKLNALKPALGKIDFVGTRLTTIAIVMATEVSDIEKRS